MGTVSYHNRPSGTPIHFLDPWTGSIHRIRIPLRGGGGARHAWARMGWDGNGIGTGRNTTRTISQAVTGGPTQAARAYVCACVLWKVEV